MAADKFKITGHIIDLQTGKDIPGLKIEAWDADLIFDDLLGKATTNEEGFFTITFDETYYQELCFDRKPDIYVKVYEDNKLIKSTEDSILWNVKNPEVEMLIQIENYTFPGKVRFTLDAFKLKTNDLHLLDQESRNYIDSKLNSCLKQQILNYFSKGSIELKATVKKLIVDYTKAGDTDLKTYIKKEIVPELEKKSDLKKELEKFIVKSKGESKIASLLHLDLPLKYNPLFKEEMRTTRVFELSKISGLNDSDAAKIAELGKDLEYAGDSAWNTLVEKGLIPEDKVSDVKLTFDLSKFSKENFELIDLLKNSQLPQLNGRPLLSMKDLIALTENDWADLLNQHDIQPPDENIDFEEYVKKLAVNIEKTFQTDYLFFHLILKNKKNEYASLKPDQITNTFKYLELEGIRDAAGTRADKKQAAVIAEIDKLYTFYENNPALDLKYTDFFNNLNYAPDTQEAAEEIIWTDINEQDRPKLKKQLMAFQRTLKLSTDFQTFSLMLENGYDSAMSVARLSKEEFAENSGLSEAEASVIHARAVQASIEVAHGVNAFQDAVTGLFPGLHVGNIGQSIYNDLKKIDGYEALFGNQDYCDCPHYRSIFGPGAYFIDLMYFIEKKVSKPVFITPGKEDNLIYLKNRRPDLWDIEITYDNTFKMIPYLEIINEILEKFLIQACDLNSPDDVYELLNAAESSFDQPFNLPLTEIKQYLKHFDLTLADILTVLKKDEKKIAREELNISEEEYVIILSADTDNIRLRYGNPQTIDEMDVQLFLKYTGLMREELDTLIRFSLINTGSNIPDLTIARVEDENDSLKFSEIITNLTLERMDIIHRFIRLWRKLSFTMEEMNLIIECFGSTLDDDDLIKNLAGLVSIQKRLAVSAEELCGLWNELPETPINGDTDGFLENRFNDIKDTIFYHKSFDENSNNNDPQIDSKTPVLLAGLEISQGDLLNLLLFLQDDLNISQQGEFELSVSTLSLLYRHAKLAKTLKVSVKENLFLINTAVGHTLTLQPGDRSENINNIKKVIDLADWIRSSAFTISLLEDLLNTEIDIVPLIEKVHNEKALYFKEDLLTAVDGILEEDSKKIINKLEANSLLEKLPISEDGENYFKLSSQYTMDLSLEDILENSDINDSAKQNPDGIREVLNSYHPGIILPGQLTAYLSVNLETLDLLLTLFDVDLCHSDFINTLSFPVDENNSDSIMPLETVTAKCTQLINLLKELKLKTGSLTFITEHPDFFSLADGSVSITSIKLLTAYRNMLQIEEDSEEDIHIVLSGYTPENEFSEGSRRIMADLLETDMELISNVSENLKPLPVNPIEAFFFIKACLEICIELGINGISLNQLTETDFEQLLNSRDSVYYAFKAKYESETAWETVIKPFKNKIEGLKRDALTDFILSRPGSLKFEDINDLFHFFLVDTQVEGCVEISRLKAAILSLQLYVHRCLANLEQSQSDEDVNVTPLLIPSKEWEWRKNYRVWEANRKVFLYPENWIEPELRDNKSPVFKELEDTLLQQKISLETAENAYRTYMNDFMQVANLKISGNYYDESCKTLYLFGRTTDDPAQYFYRKCIIVDNKSQTKKWFPWEKVDLTINADKVSPVIYQNRLYLFWVEILTKSKNDVKGGHSIFLGYDHKITLKYSSLNLSGKWSPPTSVFLNKIEDLLITEGEKIEIDIGYGLPPIEYPLPDAYIPDHDFTGDFHNEPHEEYSLQGFEWERIYPYIHGDGMFFYYCAGNLSDENIHEYDPVDADYFNTVSFFEKRIEELEPEGHQLYPVNYFSISPWRQTDPDDNYTNRYFLHFEMTDHPQYRHYRDSMKKAQTVQDKEIEGLDLLSCVGRTVNEPGIFSINASPSDYILYIENEYLLLTRTGDFWVPYRCERLGTTTAGKINKKIYKHGLDSFLSLDTQKTEKEDGHPFDNLWRSYFIREKNHIDFNGACGSYYRELYFHIPFLIANHLNANQKFEEAQKWYHYIFNPTAGEEADLDKPADRNWHFIMFRDIELPALQEILMDSTAINEYKNDPFNPHAIARLRPSAYQKTIVMKYIDNLLDWGDHLFTQDTFESINEATLLYSMAADILGKRPVKLGECDMAGGNVSYGSAAPYIDEDSEFLITMENYIANADPPTVYEVLPEVVQDTSAEKSTLFSRSSQITPYWDVDISIESYQPEVSLDQSAAGSFTVDYLDQSGLAFCVPHNEKLLSYWDRVEDRLFKIRNCMNIKGIRRTLPLFQPPIDPGVLVRAKAAGLSIEDIISSGNEIPPYRFQYLLEKAKSFTSTVQGFGSALLSALEKKDNEELILLRSVHEQNILKMTRDIKKKQVEEAKEQLNSLKASKVNLENQISHYDDLLNKGLLSQEYLQQYAMNYAKDFNIRQSVLRAVGALLYLIPNVGSPFAITYGGEQTGTSAAAYADIAGNIANIYSSIASSAGHEAGNARRKQEWEFQLKLATQQLEQMEKQIKAAEISQEIAEKDQEIHLKNLEQNREAYDFYKEKFTELGLYNWLSTSLNRLYRQAYNMAFDMAKMTELAYCFEQDTDNVFINENNWDSEKAGLLTGERLMLQLMQLEKAYLEKNIRHYEVNQSFSISQIDPRALINLRETGSCKFAIPEVCFDLSYPGQFKRLIKSVSLTIPCVTGPYTNVSCKLILTESHIRKEPDIDNELLAVPYKLYTSIATSNAVNDGGLFELNFRDERYLPFEGAGAVSSWKIELPEQFRQFDYDTISDIIIHINYTACDGGDIFKGDVENNILSELNKLIEFLADGSTSLPRHFSFKQEFANEFHQFLYSKTDSRETTLKIHKKHFPYFLHKERISIKKIVLLLKSDMTLEEELLLLENISLSYGGQSGTKGDPESINETANLPGLIFSIDQELSEDAENNDLVINTLTEIQEPDKVEDIQLLFLYTIER